LLILSFVFPVSAQSYHDITVSEAKAMIDSGFFPTILDVRQLNEYETGHIRNARLIPLDELNGRLNELNQTENILVYCQIGVQSSNASELLASNGFLNVYNMVSGLSDWMAAGYPIYIKYASIQEEIQQTDSGATIFVSSGIYYEHLTINKSLSLIGENEQTTIIDGSENGSIVSIDTDNVYISGFTIQNCGCACDGYAGILVKNNHHNLIIADNWIIQNGYGIRLNQTYNLTIINNYINDNIYSVDIYSSAKCIISGNRIVNNSWGVSFAFSSDNLICENNLTDNVIYGVRLSHSFNNSVISNCIADNQLGILLSDVSTLNQIYLNNFINNTRQAMILFAQSNMWNNSLEGNYWSNYTGTDSNPIDGIGDTPHTIDQSNKDYLPLMGQSHSFAVSSTQNVRVISNSTIEYFEYSLLNNTIKMRASNSTNNQEFGFCRVRISHALMGESYQVYIDGEEPVYANYELYDNATYRWIYFIYQHSTRQITIIPEFSFLIILSLLAITTLLFVVIRKKRLFLYAS
jgi:parallel beta-helix repeat protein